MEDKLNCSFELENCVLSNYCQNKCGEEINPDLLLEHQKICRERKYTCSFGCKFISNKNNFLEHIISLHFDQILIICDNIQIKTLSKFPSKDLIDNNINEYNFSDFTQSETTNDDSFDNEKHYIYIDSDMEDSI